MGGLDGVGWTLLGWFLLWYLGEEHQWRKRLEAAEDAARRDPLTGLENRSALLDALSERRSAVSMLGIVDLDGFKPVNDRYGHHTGDQVLQTVAGGLQTAARDQNAHVYRLGGDEFAVLWWRDHRGRAPQPLTAIDTKTAARMGRALLTEAIDPAMEVDGHWLSVGASVGVAVNDGLVSTDELMRAADSAMYECKSAGQTRERRQFHLAAMSRSAGKLTIPSVVPGSPTARGQGAVQGASRNGVALRPASGPRRNSAPPRINVRARRGQGERRQGRRTSNTNAAHTDRENGHG